MKNILNMYEKPKFGKNNPTRRLKICIMKKKRRIKKN